MLFSVGAFQFVVFSHTSRVCNSVADAPAKKAKSVVGDQCWLEYMPTNKNISEQQSQSKKESNKCNSRGHD